MEKKNTEILTQPKWSQYVSRSCSIIFSGSLLVVLFPFFSVIGVLIKTGSPGPVFFTQERGGKGGEHFTIYKFRTMIYEPEKRNLDIDSSFTDPRITKIGHFLRNTSLDELPQLINILKGEMAFVGPRPTLTSQTEKYNDYQNQRLSVKPGVTGLAQINGRNALSWSEKIDIDIEYIRKKSIRYDLYIIIQTFFKVIKPEGLYGKERKD